VVFKTGHSGVYCLLSLLISLSLTSGHMLNSGVAGALIGAAFSLSNYRKLEQ